MAKAATNSLYGAVETTPESSGHVTTQSQLPESRYVYITALGGGVVLVDDGAMVGS